MFQIFKKVPILNKSAVSSEYVVLKNINKRELKQRYSHVWKSKVIPARQMKLTSAQMPHYKNVKAISTLINELQRIAKKNNTVLETGCSTGYHGEIFANERLNIRYHGCDYSPEFIRLARQLHPNFDFKSCDAQNLCYGSNSFDVVISGCNILHIVDYEKAIAECARVAKHYVIFHRTPVIHFLSTQFFEKIGYGEKMLEIAFNESELLSLFNKHGLVVSQIDSIQPQQLTPINEKIIIKNYVCQKIKRNLQD